MLDAINVIGQYARDQAVVSARIDNIYYVQLFAKILHNGSESGSVTLANQIHFSSRVQLQLVTPSPYARLIGQRHTSAFASVMQDLRKQL